MFLGSDWIVKVYVMVLEILGCLSDLVDVDIIILKGFCFVY